MIIRTYREDRLDDHGRHSRGEVLLRRVATVGGGGSYGLLGRDISDDVEPGQVVLEDPDAGEITNPFVVGLEDGFEDFLVGGRKSIWRGKRREGDGGVA